MTEFNAGLGIPVLDDPYAAAFIVHAAAAFLSIPNVKTLSYWTFTVSTRFCLLCILFVCVLLIVIIVNMYPPLS